jgi:hypothetical protein
MVRAEMGAPGIFPGDGGNPDSSADSTLACDYPLIELLDPPVDPWRDRMRGDLYSRGGSFDALGTTRRACRILSSDRFFITQPHEWAAGVWV